jgi:anthranilate 1,2-dioxygenase large subunit
MDPKTYGWPREDYSRVPYRLYHDRSIYEREQERIFKGPMWSYVGLEAEIPGAGDFRTGYIGDTPVIVNRAKDGSLHAMVNRCAHRGALVRRETHGNAKDHICIYHKWCYGLDGSLVGLPFRRGLRGQGGMPADFDMAAHGLQRLQVASYRGVIFASFRQDVEPLADYLGPVFTRHIDRLFARPVRVLGYQRQRIAGNWKLYAENTRDTYHGSLLHEFQSTFGLSRVTQKGGVTMDARHRHNLTWSTVGTDDDAEFSALYRSNKVHESKLRLEEPSLVEFHREFDDGYSLAICSIFPNLTIHQISNSLGMRQLRTLSQDEFELVFTLFGYQDDSAEMTRHRLAQANFVGPAGLVSMEDGEAIEITHRASSGERRVNDVPVRGFWSYYAELLGIEPEGAVR